MRVALLAALVLLGGAWVSASLRWLRVAQREHYLPGSATRFARRWWVRAPGPAAALVVGVAAGADSITFPPLAFLTALVFGAGPRGLSLKGRTSPLAWTRRLRVVALTDAVMSFALAAIGAALDGLRGAVTAAAITVALAPVVCDTALLVLAPLEDVIANRYVRRATTVLGRVHPVVVGITGSYGKTSSKGYTEHLLGGRYSVVASPRSFNNRAGLARTVNELLVAGTDVLIAEMGAYGPGEIAEMCSWLRPRIAVITAIGPVHLERFRTLERTLAAKAEITVGAETVVLNTDDPALDALANVLRGAGRVVLGCSAVDPNADVALLEDAKGYRLYRSGALVGVAEVPSEGRAPAPTNLACALGVAFALGCEAESLIARLGGLPVIENRLQVRPASSGAVVLDDTFNSNPAGAKLALAALAGYGFDSGRRVVVTPGMVELGTRQDRENSRFAAAAALVATDVVVVGETNRRALVEGLRATDGAAVSAVTVRSRDEAVAWVRKELGAGDVVLYENDLPDHYP